MSLEEAQEARNGSAQILVSPDYSTRWLNIDPYQEPELVEAAGGLVIRKGESEPEILLIHRRGEWDLPKGTREIGESRKACAIREVQEEVGISDLILFSEAGTTVHGYRGYRAEDSYFVKRTYWFFMTTTEKNFSPQLEEDIDEIAWVPWSKAQRIIGYPTLRRHIRYLGRNEDIRFITQGT